ncbi:MAG: class I SAM-dependent methyltransferase [Candidatus Tritonobacter lacicola]|nr:class I SAM-dependent methyltransferase [Candidatus Tritonobacter lacicola]
MNIRKEQNEIEYVRCDLCGSDSTDLYHRARALYGYIYGDRLFNVVRCRECGLIYVSPRLAHREWLTRYHSRAYALAANPQDTFASKAIEQKYLLSRIRLGQIRQFLPRGRILDFGCGNGTFVFTALAEGWDASGIDLNEGLIKAANMYWKGHPLGESWKNARLDPSNMLAGAAGLHRKTDRLFAASPDEFSREHAGTFDLINSSQVMEHLVSPSQTVASLATMLAAGGWLIADVPNIRCWREIVKRGATLNPTAHLYYFDRSTIKRLMAMNGLEVVSISARITLLGAWVKLTAMPGLKRFIPRLAGAMRFLPDAGLGSDLIVVARKK